MWYNVIQNTAKLRYDNPSHARLVSSSSLHQVAEVGNRLVTSAERRMLRQLVYATRLVARTTYLINPRLSWL